MLNRISAAERGDTVRGPMLRVLFCTLAVLALLFVRPVQAAPVVRTGAAVLAGHDFAELAGKRVGLVTNHTALVDGDHLCDLLADSDKVTLAALFAPEHGLRGMVEDGVTVAEGIDEGTGVKVFSLYGREKKPTPVMLAGLDMLLFDMQDVGVRFYTFISTMGLAMQAAAEAHIPFVVLDRPNPLGGEYMGGPILEKEYASFVGLYPIPVAHGMTIGELASMIKGERMLPGLEGLDLRIVRMEGWHRWMQWPDTGLPWIRTSPNIPDFETALLYAGACFIEATYVNEGRGTPQPFKQVGAPDVDAGAISDALNGKKLPGVSFSPAEYTPRKIPGMCSRPKFLDRAVAGVRITVTDPKAVRPVELGIYLLESLYNSLDIDESRFFKTRGFDLLAGCDRLRQDIQDGKGAEQIIAGWNEGVRKFAHDRSKYLIY